MNSWYNTFDAVFFITVITILTGSFGLAIKYCLKSKCDNVNCCWGCITIHRNVEIEDADTQTNDSNVDLEMGNNRSNIL